MLRSRSLSHCFNVNWHLISFQHSSLGTFTWGGTKEAPINRYDRQLSCRVKLSRVTSRNRCRPCPERTWGQASLWWANSPWGPCALADPQQGPFVSKTVRLQRTWGGRSDRKGGRWETEWSAQNKEGHSFNEHVRPRLLPTLIQQPACCRYRKRVDCITTVALQFNYGHIFKQIFVFSKQYRTS